MRLLYVDDQPEQALWLHAHLVGLSTDPWEVIHATCADWALRQTRSGESIDAVLVDLDLTDAGKTDTIAQLCCANPEIPVLALTDAPDEQRALSAVRTGMEDCLVRDELDGLSLRRRLRFAAERRRRRSGSAPRVGQLSAAAIASGSGPSSPTPQRSPFLELPRHVADLRPIRLLHVDADSTFVQALAQALAEPSAGPFDTESAGSLKAAVAALEKACFDVIVVETSLPDSDGAQTVATLLNHAPSTPIVVVSRHEDELAALELIRRGADDYFPQSSLRPTFLARQIKIALARRQHRVSIRATEDESQDGGRERREHHRYSLKTPIYVVPVLSDGSPDVAKQRQGLTVDVSTGGMAFEMEHDPQLLGRRLIVGITTEDGDIAFATVELRHFRQHDDRTIAGVQFVDPEQDLLSEEMLAPSLNPQNFRLRPKLPVAVTKAWEQLGVLRPVMMARAYVCPECAGVPIFRSGCQACGSARLCSSQLIHHFACAHVDFVTTFDGGGEIVCPKCRTRSMIVGADFEYLPGPYHCLDCDWSDTKLEQVGDCLHCHLRFPIHQSREEDIIGYHVKRVEPLALVP